MRKTHTRATPASVHEFAAALAFNQSTYERAVELAGHRPDRDDWLRWLDRFLGAVGAALIIAGVAAFFAWNWADLHPMAKFALLEASIVTTVLLAWRLDIDSTGGRAALFASACLVGVLLAVFGQTYQTGADPYGLFLVWALLILPWILVGRQAGLWLLFVVLLNLTLILYWIQVLHPHDGWWQLTRAMGPLIWLASTSLDSHLAAWVFALNAGALILWEFAASCGVAWLQGRSGPRLLALSVFYTLLPPTLLLIFGASLSEELEITLLSPLLFGFALAACLGYYQYGKRDLFMLTAGVFAAILVVMGFAIRHILVDLGSLLALALLLIGLVGTAAWWLKQVAQRWEASA